MSDIREAIRKVEYYDRMREHERKRNERMRKIRKERERKRKLIGDRYL